MGGCRANLLDRTLHPSTTHQPTNISQVKQYRDVVVRTGGLLSSSTLKNVKQTAGFKKKMASVTHLHTHIHAQKARAQKVLEVQHSAGKTTPEIDIDSVRSKTVNGIIKFLDSITPRVTALNRGR